MGPISFLWPDLLWSLALLPVLVVLYIWLVRRKRKVGLRFASASMMRDAMQPGAAWRRHVAPVMFLIAIALLLVSLGRPAAIVTLPSQYKTVILAMDVSGSMRAVDVDPNRITAAQVAARAFVEDQPRNTRIGVVSFAAAALVVQPPTENREEVLSAIDRFQLQRGTAVGNGIVASLQTIFPDHEIVVPQGGPRREGRPPDPNNPAPTTLGTARRSKEPFKPVSPGSHPSAVVILLTDGQTTTGADPLESAKLAAERGVKVYTVGFGTTQGEILSQGGWRMRVRLDEETLKQIAGLTHGEYFQASTGADLKQVYQSLNSRLVFEKRESEITALFSAAAAVIAMLAGMLSLLWYNRVL